MPKENKKESSSKREVQEKGFRASKKSFEELVESQIHLFKVLNELLGRVNTMELQLERMSYYNSMLVKENSDLKNFLDTMAKKMIEDREGLSFGPPEDISPPKMPKKKIEFAKDAPLHDDVTNVCNACGRIYHINQKKCPRCGLTK